MYSKPYICTVAFAGLLGLALVRPAPAQSNPRDDQQNYDNSQQGRNDFENQQNSGQSQWQQSQNRNNNSVSGVIQSYQEVNVHGQPHFRVRIQAQNGQTQNVDLGPSSRSRELIDNIEEGEQISVQGRQQNMNGKTVLMADRARVAGRSYRIGNQSAQSEDWENQEANGEQGRQRPRSLVLLDERYIFFTPSDLSRHLIMAEENVRNGDTKAAAAELRVAAERVGIYAAAARNQGKAGQDLNNSRQELDRLADQIERGGNNQQPAQLDQTAARAQLAMAKFFDSRFRSEQQRGRDIEAGYDLQAASIHARQALMWCGGAAQRQTVQCIRQAMKTSEQMIAGSQQQAGNSQEVAQNLSREIDQIDQQIGQGEAQAAAAHQAAEEQSDRAQQQWQDRDEDRDQDQNQNSRGR